jgi:hypothetical protein
VEDTVEDADSADEVAEAAEEVSSPVLLLPISSAETETMPRTSARAALVKNFIVVYMVVVINLDELQADEVCDRVSKCVDGMCLLEKSNSSEHNGSLVYIGKSTAVLVEFS